MSTPTRAPVLDIPLARKVLEHIEAHPDEHDQAHFASRNDCGTTACIAGHTLLLSGQYELGEFDGDEFDFIESATGEVVVASDTATEMLGLNECQRYRLFFELQHEGEAVDYLRSLITAAEANEAQS